MAEVVIGVVGVALIIIGVLLLFGVFRRGPAKESASTKAAGVSFAGPPGLYLVVLGVLVMLFPFSPWWPEEDPPDDGGPAETTQPTPSGPATNVVTVEAEDGALVAPMEQRPDASASNGAYVTSPVREQGTVSIEFETTASEDDYFLWGRVKQPPSEDETRVDLNDTLFVSVDGDPDPPDIWDFVENKSSVLENWTWDRISLRCEGGSPVNHTCDPFQPRLRAGTHRLVLGGRDEFAQLDVVVITNDASYSPQ